MDLIAYPIVGDLSVMGWGDRSIYTYKSAFLEHFKLRPHRDAAEDRVTRGGKT